MGFYSNKDNRPKLEGRGWSRVAGWTATVVLSALVGSGATLFTLTKEQPASTTGLLTTSSSSTPVLQTANIKTSDATVKVVQKVKPAVMGVVNYTKQTNYFSQQSQLKATGVGSGVLIFKNSKYGYLVTNHHVVAGAAKVEVVTSKGVHIKADVVGSDPFTDLAVVRIPVSKVSNVNPVPFANSTELQAGQPVVAIGNPMGLAFQDSVTSGVISATKRTMPVETESQSILDYQSVIQTDAAINPGNSGGPLLNMQGDIVGINSSKIVAQGFNNMGFAIPANEVKNIATQLMKNGKVVHSEMGIEGIPLSQVPQSMLAQIPVNNGVYVYKVMSSKASSAGLKKGDVIVSIDGHKVSSTADLRTYIFEKKPGQTVTVQIYRGKTKKTLKITLEKYTQVPQQQSSSGGSSGGYIGGSGSSGGYIGGSGSSGGYIGGSGSGSSSSGGSSLNPFSAPGMFGG
ncbi:S1C family serine protease [Alicyclobacillus sp. SO9]|uniref:S1C family serine protease n=1 Tax=Alicyclobacillus sp. SO9 TaxID=2665646 RepID=UPI0018E7255E|nr:trypsin-like peptidase domain-containing protein [Alicyclobacillus sp. SO9]QQE77809.1 trypsin-like peptidase domain-containing protein [Alicyclobacillus sp. SO9]